MQLNTLLSRCLVLSAVLGALTGCRKEAGKPQAGAGRGAPVPVTVVVATQQNIPVLVDAIGSVRAFATVAIKSRVDGQLARVACKQGDRVRKGDLVFQIDPRPFEAAVNQARAVLARDQASLESAEADMRRTDELANTKAVSATVVDQNRAKAAALRGTVQADKAAIASAELQLSFCSIMSPVDGRVGLLQTDEGNIVKNNDTILAVINQLQPIYVDFALPESSLLQVREAAHGRRLTVEASIPQAEGAPAVGELEVIDNQVDATTGTILLRAVFANEDERLWPGQFVTVNLHLTEIQNATVVPTQAVQNSQQGEFVFVVKADSTVEQRPVKLGPARKGLTVIASGVQAGETVVTDGQLRLVPGATVNARPAGAPNLAPGATNAAPAGGRSA